MSTFMFTPSNRTSGRASTSGHTASERTRSTARTSLHSPYSAHLTRISPRKGSTRDSSGSALYLLDESVCGVAQAPPCSPQRRPLPRYQKRPVSQTRVDPATSAIRSTYAEELDSIIPVLIKRLDGLSLEDYIWEDLVMEDASQQGTSSLAFSSFWSGGLQPIFTHTLTPSTPSASFLSFPPTTPTYAISPRSSTVESSPVVQTPAYPSFVCPVNPSTSIRELSSSPTSPGEIHDTPMIATAVSIHSSFAEDELDANLERELLALIEEEIKTTSIPGEGPNKKTHEKRAQNAAKRMSKPKAISAQQIMAGTSTPRRWCQPSPIRAPDALSTPSGPVNRRRRGRATEDMIWKGVDAKLQSAKHTSRRRRSAGQPYSQEQRLQRGQKLDKGLAEVPKCVTKARDVLVGASSGVAKGRKACAKCRSSLPSSESFPSMSRTFIAPKPPQGSRSQSAVPRKGRVATEDGYQSADEAQYIRSLMPEAINYLDKPSTLISSRIKKENIMSFLQSALAFIPPEVIFPNNEK